MTGWKKTVLGAAAAVLLVGGTAAPANAAGGSHGTYCGPTTATCQLVSSLHTTSGSVTIEWHNSDNPYEMILQLNGPNNYTCRLEGAGSSKSKICPSVPAGKMTLTMYKAKSYHAYFGASWS